MKKSGRPAEQSKGTPSRWSPTLAAWAATTLAACICNVLDTESETAPPPVVCCSPDAACTWHPYHVLLMTTGFRVDRYVMVLSAPYSTLCSQNVWSHAAAQLTRWGLPSCCDDGQTSPVWFSASMDCPTSKYAQLEMNGPKAEGKTPGEKSA